MHIASLNVNVLGRHFDEVQGVLVDLDIHNPAQNETKHDGLYPNERPHIPSYQRVRNDRSCHAGGYYRTYCYNLPRNIIEAGIHRISLSDHYMVYCIRKQNGSITKGHKMIKTKMMNNFIEGDFLPGIDQLLLIGSPL